MNGAQGIFAVALLIFAPLVQAASSGDDFIPGNSFLTVTETASSASPLSSASQDSFGRLAFALPGAESALINTLQWIHTRTFPPRPREAYDRAGHFGSWIDLPSDRTCFNTRGLILIRDSQRPVTVFPNDPCFINTGAWNDPYTGRLTMQAKDLQIDHVVPLKNAYISGAFAWTWKTRCAYANFMGNKFHLRAVDSAANMAKGDNTPAQFLPPNRAFTCDYLADWLKIKLIWRLMMSERETLAIANLVKAAGCDPRIFHYSAREVAAQRQAIVAFQNECPNTPGETAWPTRH